MTFKNNILSTFLLKKYDLWLWDFDDTLIDTFTYYIKNMEPLNILQRNIYELEQDIPSWKYFKELILYLVQNNIKVGIVSFGTYKIIKAYMDRIFGLDQKIFTNKNLIALCRNDKGFPIKFYPNKNAFINTIMTNYNISNKNKVILFDDFMTNVSSALNIGIFALKIKGKSSNISQYTDPKNLFNQNTLLELESYLKKKEDTLITFNKCNNYYLNKIGSIGYRKNYSHIINKQASEKENELNESILNLKKKNIPKPLDFKYKFKLNYTGNYDLIDDYRRNKICDKFFKKKKKKTSDSNIYETITQKNFIYEEQKEKNLFIKKKSKNLLKEIKEREKEFKRLLKKEIEKTNKKEHFEGLSKNLFKLYEEILKKIKELEKYNEHLQKINKEENKDIHLQFHQIKKKMNSIDTLLTDIELEQASDKLCDIVKEKKKIEQCIKPNVCGIENFKNKQKKNLNNHKTTFIFIVFCLLLLVIIYFCNKSK